MLTERQKAIFDFILDYRRSNGCSPSIPEMQKAFSIRSPNGVAGHLLALEAKGCIRRARRGSRQIDVISPLDDLRQPSHDLPLYGWNAAGPPKGCITIDEESLGFRPDPACFALRVHGDTMRDAGLLDGDLVVVDAGAKPRAGRIVAVAAGGEIALERFVRRAGSAAPVRGVVRTVVRKLG